MRQTPMEDKAKTRFDAIKRAKDMTSKKETDFEFQGEKINQKKFDKEMKAYVKTLVNESSQECRDSINHLLVYPDSPLIDDLIASLIASAKAEGRREVLSEVETRLTTSLKAEWWLEVVYKVGTDDMKKKYDKPKNICLWTEDELKQKFQKEGA